MTTLQVEPGGFFDGIWDLAKCHALASVNFEHTDENFVDFRLMEGN